MPEKLKVDLTEFEGAQSLGANFEEYLLGLEIKEILQKLKEAAEYGISHSKTNYDHYIANNVFIDGRRGSGKTTVLLTVKEILESMKNPNSENKYRDILRKTGLDKFNFLVVENLIDTSVNTQSITFYFLSWLKKKIEEEHKTDTELHKLLYKTINSFPPYLMTCDKICKELNSEYGLEELLDKSDLAFRRKLFELISRFLDSKCNESKSMIVLFIDDLDISFPPSRIEKILTEIFMFLSHPRLIIISSGNYENLIQTLRCYVNEVSKNCFGEPSYKNRDISNIAKSFLEKTFSRFRVKLPELAFEKIQNITVKTNKGTFELKGFMEKVGIIKTLGWNSIIFKLLFNQISVREFIFLLREMEHKIKNTEDKSVLKHCFSDIYTKIRATSQIISYSDTKIRELIKIDDNQKPNEFFIVKQLYLHLIEKLVAKGVETQKELKLNPLMNEYYKQSILAYGYQLDNKKEFALLWLWLLENLIYMDGFKNTVVRILFIEFLRFLLSPNEVSLSLDKENENLSLKFIKNFLTFWEKLIFDFKELNSFLSQSSALFGVTIKSLKDFLNGKEKYPLFKIDLISKIPNLESMIRCYLFPKSANIQKDTDKDKENLKFIWKNIITKKGRFGFISRNVIPYYS